PELAALLRERAAGGWSTVMTPLDGEAKRFYEALNSPQGWGVERYPSECPPPREGLSKALAAAYGATVVAKGPVTYVATSGGATWDFRDGSPALATAGTGDVLAGIIAALMAQGLSAYDASRLGVTMHGLAGVDAARELTSICVTAADVIEHIPAAVRGIAGKEN
ncbi:MAG: NAD(P)H-hydrate dehydratase, partial [Coriobacteriales bacterium]|nr:NAD(P)H-hydrate dehydratase [Coriobacteriales bacterium]